MFSLGTVASMPWTICWSLAILTLRISRKQITNWIALQRLLVILPSILGNNHMIGVDTTFTTPIGVWSSVLLSACGFGGSFDVRVLNELVLLKTCLKEVYLEKVRMIYQRHRRKNNYRFHVTRTGIHIYIYMNIHDIMVGVLWRVHSLEYKSKSRPMFGIQRAFWWD